MTVEATEEPIVGGFSRGVEMTLSALQHMARLGQQVASTSNPEARHNLLHAAEDFMAQFDEGSHFHKRLVWTFNNERLTRIAAVAAMN